MRDQFKWEVVQLQRNSGFLNTWVDVTKLFKKRCAPSAFVNRDRTEPCMNERELGDKETVQNKDSFTSFGGLMFSLSFLCSLLGKGGMHRPLFVQTFKFSYELAYN